MMLPLLFLALTNPFLLTLFKFCVVKIVVKKTAKILHDKCTLNGFATKLTVPVPKIAAVEKLSIRHDRQI